MHEYPLTEQIVQIAGRRLAEAGGSRVTAIHLVLGENSGIVPESIHMYFDLIAAGTPCQDARIEIERVRAKLRCPACGALFVRKPMSFACPECGTDGHPTAIGKEFYIKSIEVEGAEDAPEPKENPHA